jgi:hypothetical protein
MKRASTGAKAQRVMVGIRPMTMSPSKPVA